MARVLGLAVALGMAATQVLADPCDASAQPPLEDMVARLPQCERNALWLFRLGGHLIDAGRYAEAADHLERALLLQPDAADLQLAYAIALAGSGDVVSAMTLLRDVQRRPDLPPNLADAVAAARQRWLQGQIGTPARSRRITAGLRIGHDSNLLGAPNAGSLALTLPNETIILPLEPTSLPKSGGYRRADIRIDGTLLVTAEGRLDASAGLLDRSSPAVPEANTRQADIQLEWVRATRPGDWGWYGGANANDLRTDGGTRMRSHGISLGAEWHPAARPQCEARAGLDWQERRLASNAVLSGRFWGLSGLFACSSNTVAAAGSTAPRRQQWAWRVGQDSPLDSTRPGGRQFQLGVRGTWVLGDIRSGAWTLDADLSQQRDRTGYSALLDNGAKRSITRLTARAEYQRQVLVVGQSPVVLSAGLDVTSQHSNLALFRMRSWGPYIGIRSQF